MDMGYNRSAMEQIMRDNESDMRTQISNMQTSIEECKTKAAELNSQADSYEASAAQQEHIAATAMKTEYYTDSKGRSRSRQVPDVATRAAAAEKAKDYRDRAAEKRDQAAAMLALAHAYSVAINVLEQHIKETNAYINKLIQLVENTDLTHAQLMAQINSALGDYIGRVEALYKSFNDSFPLTSDEVTVLNNMGINAYAPRDMANEQYKITLQSAEYQKMYETLPSRDDLNNLFFITDMRLRGDVEEDGQRLLDMLFAKQMEISENLYTLATYYPAYYKLADQYGLGTPAYNAKLEEFRNLLANDFTMALDGTKMVEIKDRYGNVVEIREMNNYVYDWKTKDAILNGAVEQAIYEIKGMPGKQSTASSISNQDWYKFTTQINKVILDTSVVYDSEIQTVRGNISQLVHLERNTFNRAPETWDDFINQHYKTSDTGWHLQLLLGSGYHMFGSDGAYNVRTGEGKDGLTNIKFYHDSGSEAVYNLQTGELLLYHNDKNSLD